MFDSGVVNRGRCVRNIGWYWDVGKWVSVAWQHCQLTWSLSLCSWLFLKMHFVSAGLCLEKRVFYRLISGLHSSINIHLCGDHLLDGTTLSNIPPIQRALEYLTFASSEAWGRSVWGPDLQEFRRRFDMGETKGEGTRRLKNLYFLFLIELRALYKVVPYFERAIVGLYTGNSREDRATKELLLELLSEIK